MKNENRLRKLKNKRIRYNILKFMFFSVILGLILVGSVSIVSLLIYLYQCYNVSFLGCLILDIVLPNIYSLMVNEFLKPFDNKLKNMFLEIKQIEDVQKIEQEKEKVIKNIKTRLNNLSIGNQIVVLNFIKNNCLIRVDNVEEIDKLNMDDTVVVIDKLNEIQGVSNDSKYSKKRVIEK